MKLEVIDILKSVEEVDSEGKINYGLDGLHRDELIKSFVEIETLDTDQFLKIKETLTRIGIANRREKRLYTSCMLLHKKGKFYICHFKELFGMDEKYTQMYVEDYTRRNRICEMLQEWGLIKIKNSDIMYSVSEEGQTTNIYVLPYKDKKEWDIVSKYTIGTVPVKKQII